MKMPDCNNTEVFFKELVRMCNNYRYTKYNASCAGCEIYQHCYDSSCYGFVKNKPSIAIEIVQKWSDENPPKTRQSEFLKMFPNAVKCADESYVMLCPQDVDRTFSCPNTNDTVVTVCAKCQQEYWLSEVE